MRFDAEKEAKKLEKVGGALPGPKMEGDVVAAPPQPRSKNLRVKHLSGVSIATYKDTPMKRAYRELDTHYAPIFKGEQRPDFARMRELIRQHDTTEFKPTDRLQVMPENGPSGNGYDGDDRETSHFVHQTLRSINPLLATSYLHGKGIHNDFEDHYRRTDFAYGKQGYSAGRDHKRKQHRLYNINPSGDQSGPKSRLIMVGGGYRRNPQKYY